jgi:NAD(P)-dependent dehydrogenase (short-subunit alcohol dehydrogenase family)
MQVSLENKVALITGAGAGIGLATAEAFASLGAKLAIAEIAQDKSESLRKRFESMRADALVIQADVRDAKQVQDVARQIDARFGRLDVLVNNVGHHLGIFNQLTDSTEEQWQQLYEINLRHMFIVSRAMIPLMRRSGNGGSIINLSSIEGFRGYPLNVIYGTFKHAVTGFTRGLALELALDRIRVNLIAPETTDTEQVPIGQFIKPQNRAKADLTLPLNRFGRPEDSAGAAVFLASDLSGWVTGQSLIVDGGGLVGNIWQRVPPDNRWTNLPFITGACNG